MLSDDFNDRLEQAFSIIGQRLSDCWLTFGRNDFPSDKGVSFRNTFIKFPLSFIAETREPEETDDWYRKNLPLLERLTEYQIVRVIGILHFYVASWDSCRFAIDPAPLRIQLDWIFNTYGFPASASLEWYDLSKRCEDRREFPEGQRKMYDEIASIIGADPRDEGNAKCWSGIAIIVRHGQKFDEAAHNAWCDSVFPS
jgi:hypothetical protein